MGINCSRVSRKVGANTEITVTKTKRNPHQSETFPTLVGVQCMDGGKYHDEIAEGNMSEEEYLAAWKASSNRAMDFGTTGELWYAWNYPPVQEIHIASLFFLSIPIVAVSVHLVSIDGKHMLWATEGEMDGMDSKSQAFLEKFIMPDFERYKEYAVSCIFSEGMLGKSMKNIELQRGLKF